MDDDDHTYPTAIQIAYGAGYKPGTIHPDLARAERQHLFMECCWEYDEMPTGFVPARALLPMPGSTGTRRRLYRLTTQGIEQATLFQQEFGDELIAGTPWAELRDELGLDEGSTKKRSKPSCACYGETSRPSSHQQFSRNPAQVMTR
jgi:hypothetical protein